MNSFIRLYAILACVLLLSPFGYTSILIKYDLDSLSYLSSDIVEVVLTKINVITEARVMAVYKGSLTNGQNLRIAELINEYRVNSTPQHLRHRYPLATGDYAILFMTNTVDNVGNSMLNQPLFTPVPSGAKLIQNQNVLDCLQIDNPGPYYFMHSQNPASVNNFKDKLRASIQYANDFLNRYQVKASTTGGSLKPSACFPVTRWSSSDAQTRRWRTGRHTRPGNSASWLPAHTWP